MSENDPQTAATPTVADVTRAQSTTHIALRRLPVQQRSAERVDRMLDACAALLDQIGYAKLTTTLIARDADVAIGSVYQFFGDKRAVVRALGMRHLDMFFTRLSDQTALQQPQQWWELVDIVIDEYIAMHRCVPGFRTLHFGDIVDENLLDEARTNNDVLASRLVELINERFSADTEPHLELVLTIAVEAGDALVKLAFRNDPDGDNTMLAETKNLIREYLQQRVSKIS